MTPIRCVDPACADGPREDDQQPRPRWAVDGLLCRRCYEGLERRVAELPARAQALRAVLGGIQGQHSSDSKTTKGMPPVPLNLAAHDHLEEMQAQVVSWVRMTCEERSLRGPDRSTLDVLAPWLLSQLPWLAGHGAVDDLCREVREMTRTATALAGTEPRWHRKPSPCDGCQATELGRWDGEDVVVCAACGYTYSPADYLRSVAAHAATSPALIGRAEACHLLGVTRGAFRVMVHRREVVALEVIAGHPVYAAGEVEALRQAREARRAG